MRRRYESKKCHVCNANMLFGLQVVSFCLLSRFLASIENWDDSEQPEDYDTEGTGKRKEGAGGGAQQAKKKKGIFGEVLGRVFGAGRG